MKAYRTITWVLDDDGKLVRPGGIARLGDSSLAKLGFSVNREPVDDNAPLTDEEKAVLRKLAADAAAHARSLSTVAAASPAAVEAAQPGEQPVVQAEQKPKAADVAADAAKPDAQSGMTGIAETPPETEQTDAQAATGASTTDPARKEPQAKPAKSGGDAGKGSK